MFRILLLSALMPVLVSAQREIRLINDHWEFRQGKLDDPARAADPGPEWKSVHLPHDWAIAGPFMPEVSGEQGKLPWRGEGWYRKSLRLKPADLAGGRRAILLFDGVMANPVVSVNGHRAGSWKYGYNSFHLDITPFVRPGDNLVTVHASTLDHHSRWYPGAGIYRKVSLILADAVHVPVWGVQVTTPEITETMAKVFVRTEVVNRGGEATRVEVRTQLLDPEGVQIGSSITPLEIEAGATAIGETTLDVPNPKRWDVLHPHLHTIATTLHRDGIAIDQTETRFGIRTIRWTADDGFHLNGRRVQLQGVCLHHDNGALGAAEYRDALARKLLIMRGMGVNAIRTSHNAPAPELLELCDEMGLLVIDELFDKYGPTASVNTDTADYIENHAAAEVENFVRRDRNHPSVVLWSIGNEVPDILNDKTPRAKELMEKLVGMFRQWDTTRPTNMACHITNGAVNGSLDPVDSSGWNYGQKYLRARERYPDKPLIYTESASAFSTRGFYAFPHPKNRNDFHPEFTESSYDLTSATWSDIPDVEFMRMERDRYIAGEFVWTGFDYLGEPTPHTKNARSSYFGIVDLAGLKKDRYFLYRSHWLPEEPTLHILPHWTWPDRIGLAVPVYVYTNGDEAELFLNGRSLGRRAKGNARASSNLALNKPARATSEEIKQDAGGNVQMENRADKAFDGDPNTRWCAADETLPQSIEVDLGREIPLRHVAIHWEKAAAGYNFEVGVSRDGQTWEELADVRASANRSVLAPDSTARHLRVTITRVPEKAWASIAEITVASVIPPESEALAHPYYQIMDRYRLRWENVIYEPGTLEVVARKEGKEIGRARVSTAGPAQALRLTPEPVYGDDLRYVLVEAVDGDGRPAPRDMSVADFQIEGPATIAGIDNGNPVCLDPFQDHRHPLFHGKAVLILRRDPGASGQVKVHARAAGLRGADATVAFGNPANR